MQTIQYKNHTIKQYDLVCSDSSVVIIIHNNEFNETVAYKTYKQVNQHYTFNEYFIRAKALLDSKLDDCTIKTHAPVVYRKQGLKYMVFNKRIDTPFVKGSTKYVYAYKYNNEYHYKAMPVIQVGDMVALSDNKLLEVLFIESVNNVDHYYLKNSDMKLYVLTRAQMHNIETYIHRSEVTSDQIIADKNDAKISLRLPTYLLDILKLQSCNDNHKHGMSLNSTIRECLLYALDNYMNRLM